MTTSASPMQQARSTFFSRKALSPHVSVFPGKPTTCAWLPGLPGTWLRLPHHLVSGLDGRCSGEKLKWRNFVMILFYSCIISLDK